MTTIAFDGKVLACDSQVTGEYIDPNGYQKVWRRDGKLIAISGNYLDCEQYLENGTLSSDDVVVLEINTKTNQVFYIAKDGRMAHKLPVAIGSGSKFAMGAMLAGASAYKAVKVAATLDPYTGGAIKTYKTNYRK